MYESGGEQIRPIETRIKWHSMWNCSETMREGWRFNLADMMLCSHIGILKSVRICASNDGQSLSRPFEWDVIKSLTKHSQQQLSPHWPIHDWNFFLISASSNPIMFRKVDWTLPEHTVKKTSIWASTQHSRPARVSGKQRSVDFEIPLSWVIIYGQIFFANWKFRFFHPSTEQGNSSSGSIEYDGDLGD